MSTFTDRTLLRLHLEAVWGIRLPAIEQDEIELLPESVQPGWKLCVAEIAGRRILIWRKDIAREEQERVRPLIDSVLDFSVGRESVPGVSREIAFSLADVARLSIELASKIAQQLTPGDWERIETFPINSVEYYTQVDKQPLVGVIDAGKLVCLAHSARRTEEACELGIDTLPEARRKGYALATTIIWTQTILSEGLIPLYSALAENSASLQLAKACGYHSFARVATLGG
jgi:hypothetical protein